MHTHRNIPIMKPTERENEREEQIETKKKKEKHTYTYPSALGLLRESLFYHIKTYVQ